MPQRILGAQDLQSHGGIFADLPVFNPSIILLVPLSALTLKHSFPNVVYAFGFIIHLELDTVAKGMSHLAPLEPTALLSP